MLAMVYTGPATWGQRIKVFTVSCPGGSHLLPTAHYDTVLSTVSAGWALAAGEGGQGLESGETPTSTELLKLMSRDEDRHANQKAMLNF